MLKIKNYSKSYIPGKYVVKNININVNKGDIYGFIGHNGAGKSTTIKSIVGILPFDEGDILIDGISVKDNPLECKKMIAYIPDNPDIYESLTGIQYLNFIADVFKVHKQERQSIIEKYAKKFEIYDDLNNFINTYSHGMKQKLVIISAFLHQPKLLVLDEPFVGLDPKATFLVKQAMTEFCENGGAVFFSTHVLEVAEKLCNKISIIKNGELIISGQTEDIIKDSSLEEVFMEHSNNE